MYQTTYKCPHCDSPARRCSICKTNVSCCRLVSSTVGGREVIERQKFGICRTCTRPSTADYESLTKLPPAAGVGSKCSICEQVWPRSYRACPMCREATISTTEPPTMSPQTADELYKLANWSWYQLHEALATAPWFSQNDDSVL